MDQKQPQAQSQPPKPQQNFLDPHAPIPNPNDLTAICKHCHEHVPAAFYFCPNCGNKIHEPPYKFSFLATTGVILESILLPPLGIFPGIRYLRKDDSKAKIIGITAIIITIIMTILMAIFLKNYIDALNKQLNNINYIQNMYENPQGSVFEQAEELQKLNQ